MKWSKPRLSVRAMMVAVVVLALASLGAREYWIWWLRQGFSGPGFDSETSTYVRSNTWVRGRPVPVSFAYKFTSNSPKPATGATSLLWASVWFEDMQTGRYVDGYTFDMRLPIGGRESASGAFTWDAEVPRPGCYLLRFYVYHVLPDGSLKMSLGGSSNHQIDAADPASRPADDPGVEP